MMFGLLILNNLVVNMDNGAIPAATKDIMDDLHLNKSQLGLLGSILFMGLLVGSVIASFIMGKISYKALLAFSNLGNGVALIMFSVSKTYWVQGLARFISGVNQSVLTIYFPLYVDTFGTKETEQ